MGVVRERKIVCESAKVVPSNPESAANSGYTTQESEDEEQEPHPSQRQSRVTLLKISNFNFNQTITRHTGKRKARRILNGRFLETLKEEEEDDVLIPNKKSNFQILMEVNEDAIECMNAYDQFCANSSCLLFQENKRCYDNSYLNIPRKIRAAIGGRKNFRYDLLKTIETDFFNNENYTHFPITCYERFLVHAVAKYYGLSSETIIINGKKAVKILGKCASDENQKKQLLCDYIREIRNEAELCD